MKLSGGPLTIHYMLAIVLAFIFLAWSLLSIALFHRDGRIDQGIIVFDLMAGILALLIWHAKWNDLRFARYETQSDAISNCNLIRALAEFHRWEVLRDDEGILLHIKIPKSSFLSMSEGEALTVLFEGSAIFVNCIPFPEGRSCAPSSWTSVAARVKAVVEAVEGRKA